MNKQILFDTIDTEALSDYINNYCEVFQTGSQVICEPPPPIEESDYDFLILFNQGDREQILDLTSEDGWEMCGEDEYGYYEDEGYGFFSVRKGSVNLICTSDPLFYKRYTFATDLAMELNLKEKEDRVTLFEYIVNRIGEVMSDDERKKDNLSF